jgi:hypothetical protein
MAMMNGKENINMSAASNMSAMIGYGTAIEAMVPTAVASIQADFGDIEEIHLDDHGMMDSDEIHSGRRSRVLSTL